jgi:uncharacterized membrane protein
MTPLSTPAGRSASEDLERRVGRLLIAVTYVSVVLLLAGVALMLVSGISPLAGGPPLDLAELPGQLARLEPAAFLWAGILAVIATPLSRVVAAAVGFARAGDRLLVLVAIGILVVIAVSVATALIAES